MNTTNGVLILSDCLDLLLKITETVYSTLEANKAGSFRMQNSTYAEDTQKFRDQLYMAAALTDNGLIALVTTIFVCIPTRQSCNIDLAATGKIVMTAEEFDRAMVGTKEIETPSLIFKERALGLKILSDVGELTQTVLEINAANDGIAAAAKKRNNQEDYPAENL